MNSCLSAPPVVIDNGTGFTKLGYAGNSCPQFIFPTLIACRDGPGFQSSTGSSSSSASGASLPTTSILGSGGGSSSGFKKKSLFIDDLDFYIGHEVQSMVGNNKAYSLNSPIKHGQIDNWDMMEKFWEACIFKYLQCEPEDHLFLLTESPLNPPENREYSAEIMFESFNVPGLYIGVQALLALTASWASEKVTNRSLTGVVIDSGDGLTHIIPVADGYVLGSVIKSIPLAGKEITFFIQQLLREREANSSFSSEDSLEISKQLKENYCYVCPDIVREFRKYELEPDKYFKRFESRSNSSVKNISFDVGFERFLAPEIFFNPEMASSEFLKPLPELVDDMIQMCPIDVRRGLYKNIVLSGGSTMFKDFGKRIQRDIKRRVDERLNKTTTSCDPSQVKATAMEINVISHSKQQYAVWYGGSLLASTTQFPSVCHTKAEYEEYGPSICRQSRAFTKLV